MVGFGEAIKRAFAGGQHWSGRSTRAEYWWWFLFVWLLSFIPYIGIFATMDWTSNGRRFVRGVGRQPDLLDPGGRRHARRSCCRRSLCRCAGCTTPTAPAGGTGSCSDPVGIGGIWYLVLMLLPSTQGQNQYG